MKKGEDFSGFIAPLDRLNTTHRSLYLMPGLAIMGTSVTAVVELMR